MENLTYRTNTKLCSRHRICKVTTTTEQNRTGVWNNLDLRFKRNRNPFDWVPAIELTSN